VTLELAACINAARKIARRRKIEFREPALHREEVLACALNPMHFMFVSWDGRVGPCTYLLLPVEGPIPRWNGRETNFIEQVVFGTVDGEGISHFLSSSPRRNFITTFQKRIDAERDFIASLDLEPSIRSLRAISQASAERAETLSRNPLPAACNGCPKTNGW
jgi:hypothetical protein